MSITVYSQPGCQPCRMTKKQFEKLGIDYEDIDISKSEEGMSVVRELGYAQVPVVVAGDVHWSGFRQDQIRGLAEVVSTL